MHDSYSIGGKPPRKRSGPFRAVLDLFSSVWFGIFLLVLLFAYSSIGSAVPRVRQHYLLEMTEFQWFNWWPFDVLIGLLCLNIAIVTVRRIPLRLVNLGVWMIHTGILILCAGSVYYFGTKIEGDTPVFRRQIKIEVPGAAHPVRIVALSGNQAIIEGTAGSYQFSIQNTNSEWPLLSEADKGKTAYAVNVMVTPPTGKPFVRQLLAGYPQYTEDVIPGQGRAVKSTGRKLLDEDLELSLDYEPQDYFSVMDTWALFARRPGEHDWIQRPIKGLPRYHERVSSREQVTADPPIPVRPIDLKVPAISPDDPLSDVEVHVTGYLRAAEMRHQWQEGGDHLNPVLQFNALSHGTAPQSFDLVAFDPQFKHTANGMIELRWMPDPSMIDTLPTDSRPALKVAIPASNFQSDVTITRDSVVGKDGPFSELADTQFQYRVVNLAENLSLADGSTTSVAIVDIKMPDGTIVQRWVSDRPGDSKDMMQPNADPHGGGHAFTRPDPRIDMVFRPSAPPLIFAAYPNGQLEVVWSGAGAAPFRRTVQMGEVVQLAPGFSVQPTNLLLRAEHEMKPRVIPPEQRDRNLGEAMAMIRLEVISGGKTVAQWLPFSAYALPDAQYGYRGRFPYMGQTLQLPDGRQVELMFSRERRLLPTSIALDEFQLQTNVGGYTGSAATIRNYVSRLRFWDKDRWSEPSTIGVNSPTEFGGYWYFQAMWDRPPGNSLTAGMNYTGLGVGNRNGVYIQLAGCCIAVLGMIFAFYIKPIIKQRRRNRLGELEQFSAEGEDRVAAPVSVGVTQ